ncbi:MAG: peptide deformylase [Rickettsiales bacterium]
MTVLPIVVAPDPLLKMKSEPVEKITPEIKQLLNDMLDTMYASNGIGLSAVQVGVLKRVIVVDTEWESPRYRTEGEERTDEKPKPGKPIKMINPEIVEESPEDNTYNEGCLSFPGQYSEVTRPKAIRLKYLDENGAEHQITADGLLATCLQHEIDHMNGIVFVDHVSSLKRDMIMRKMKKAKKQES